MIVTGKASRSPRRTAFSETEDVRDRKEGLRWLRMSLGSIQGQTDEQYLDALKALGITVAFEED